MSVTLDSLTVNESIPTRSRTFTPEVVQRIRDLFAGVNGAAPAQNIGIGTYDKEGGARSALASVNKILAATYGEDARRGATVRATEDGKYKAILLNKPAKAKPDPKAEEPAKPAAPKPAQPAKS